MGKQAKKDISAEHHPSEIIFYRHNPVIKRRFSFLQVMERCLINNSFFFFF